MIPCEYLYKLYLSRNFNDCPTWCWNHTIVSLFIWTKHRNVTDGQTELVWWLQRSALRTDTLWKCYMSILQHDSEIFVNNSLTARTSNFVPFCSNFNRETGTATKLNKIEILQQTDGMQWQRINSSHKLADKQLRCETTIKPQYQLSYHQLYYHIILY